MTTSEIIQALERFSPVFPRQALSEAIRQREAVTPPLLEALDYAFENAARLREEESDYYLHVYAMYLLAQFREPQAFPKLVRLLTLDEESLEYLVGDCLTEDYDTLLSSTYDGDPAPLQAVVEDCSLFEFARVAAIDTCGMLYGTGRIGRDALISFFRGALAGPLATDKSYAVTKLAHCAIDWHLIEMIPDVKALFERDAVDPMVFGEYDSFIDLLFDYRKARTPRAFLEDALGAMENWACFEREETPPRPSVPSALKPGRNDPCPCGSGKKYKKCCLERDEQLNAPFDPIKYHDPAKHYPSLEPAQEGNVSFLEHFGEDAVSVDRPVYYALYHEGKTLSQDERTQLLLKAFDRFAEICERDGLGSFAAFDQAYMVHYPSERWVAELAELLEKNKTKHAERLSRVLEAQTRFAQDANK